MGSICDYCGEEVPEDDVFSCAECDGTYCEHHIDELEHECEGGGEGDD